MRVNTGGWLGAMKESVFQAWGYAPALVERLQAIHPILIHAHFGLDGLRARSLSKKLGIPLVVTFHGYDATIFPQAPPSRHYRNYVRRRHVLGKDAAVLIAVSRHIQGKLMEHGFPAEKVAVHYIGVDPDFFQADAALPRDPLVLFVARLVEKKGCEYLIRAMAQVQATMPNVRLVIIGNGLLRGKLEDLAKRICKDASFLGVRSQDEIRHWMNRATVFCVPSITAANGDQEAFGMVFAEAQAMGLPVVSFASAGVPEAVADGETGLLCSERDVNGLARNIGLLLSDKNLWSRMSRAGVARIRSQFNIHTQTRILEDIYSMSVQETVARAGRQSATLGIPELPAL